ncbi:hypothetical protein C3486_08145 [Streptomyces sp. Ru73]|uniref:hypothetical protein n=1 Tax=Streptomyces sp. Ru73 TaxID=2080748 RepID=UPI000CDD31A4|nr:hypothetical protein [Streptomyces sp. Ru73]POX41722.1 hypothetical protein C3486_08145 [Streptomyces sp. Ru73]
MSATSTLAMTHLVPLAKDLDENKVTPGVLGFIVFAVIGGAVWLLMKSMNKHMRKVDFEEKPGEGAEGAGPAPSTDSTPPASAKSTAPAKGAPKTT